MSPKEYIEQIKVKFQEKNLNPSFFETDLFKSELKEGETEEELKKFILETDYAQYLFNTHRNRIPLSLLELYDKGNLALGEIQDPTPNAYCKKISELHYAVVFNVGLKNFIYRIIRAYSTRFVLTEGNNDMPTLSFEDTCQKIADIFWWFHISDGQAYGPNYPISQDQIYVASIIATEAELFFLSHELGHVLIDIIKESPDSNQYKEDFGEI